MKALTIGKLATQSGVGIETVRFYERNGLIPKPPRSDAGYRLYSNEAVRRVQFIRHAKDLGFSLKEIKELLSLRASPRAKCTDVRAKATAKIADIESRIASLKAMKKALAMLIAQCSGDEPATACPILEALNRKTS